MAQSLRSPSREALDTHALVGSSPTTIRRTRRSMSAIFVSAALVLGVTVGAASPSSALPPEPVLTLSVVAGTGTSALPTPGPATSSALRGPNGVAVDGLGNVYVADQTASRVLKVTPGGTLSIFAGTGSSALPTPGPATSSALVSPKGVAVDSAGNVYIADVGRVVVKVTPGGTLSYFAGTGTYGTPTPGPATSSLLLGPESVAVDAADNVYIADGPRVLKVTSEGTLSVIAGNGFEGRPVAGPATSSPLASYNSLAVDSAGNVFVVGSWEDEDEDNNYTYSFGVKVTPGGTLSYVTGTGRASFSVQSAGPAISSALYRPKGVAADSAGNVYITDMGVVVKVTSEGTLSIFAGKGTPNYGAPTPGPVADSKVIAPSGIAVDAAGAVYIVDAYLLLKVSYPVLETAPEAPTSLAATAGNGSASIAFTAGADGGAAITKYQYRIGSGSWVDAVGTSSPITISGLTNYLTRNIRLRAVNSAGDGAASAAVKVFPRAAGPTLSSVKAAGSTRIRVAIAVFTPPSGSVSHFWIYAYTKGTSTVVGSCRSTAAARGCLISGLAAGTEYDIAARGFFRNNLLSPVWPTSDGVKQTVSTNN